MKIRVRIPKVGLTTEEVTVATWEKSEGDRVASGELLATVEGDKAIIEIVSPSGGVLVTRLASVGDVLAIGAEIALLET